MKQWLILLIRNSVAGIAIDGSGRKWFGMTGGVSEFDGQTWHSYTQSDGLASNIVTAIARTGPATFG